MWRVCLEGRGRVSECDGVEGYTVRRWVVVNVGQHLWLDAGNKMNVESCE